MARGPSTGVNKSEEIRAYLSSKPNAGPKEIVAALKEKGVAVSEGLVSNVKSMSRKRGGKRRVRRGRGRGGVNKSEAIRSYLASHPGATPKQIKQALSSQGIEASEGLISVVKYGGKKGGGGRRLVRRGVGASRGGNGLSAADLLAVKAVSDQLGGVQEVRRAIEALEQLGIAR